MPELKLLDERPERGIDIVGWSLRIGLGFAFLHFGWERFPSGPGSPWVEVFARIGIGQWFRYATGIIEVTGALLLLVPKATPMAATLLGGTMCGAMLVHVALGKPSNAIFPAMFLAAILAIGVKYHLSRPASLTPSS